MEGSLSQGWTNFHENTGLVYTEKLHGTLKIMVLVMVLEVDLMTIDYILTVLRWRVHLILFILPTYLLAIS
jgi:hypothetical protein